MGHKELDKIPRSLIGKNINPMPNKVDAFIGYKHVIDNYKSGDWSRYRISNYFNNVQDSLEADNKYNENNQLVLEGLQKILDLINNGSIKRNEIKIIDSIKNISQAIMNEKYYTTSNSGNIVPSDYTGFFNKLVIDFNKNPSLLKLDDIDNILNELYNATYNFDLNNNEKFYQESIGRTKKLYSALNKIYNLGVDYQTKKKKN